MSAKEGLIVYRASAGSGKTYTLTLEYLKQVLRSSHSTGIFRGVLAVTFTNKATEEMKSRILSALNDLAEGKDPTLSKTLESELKIDDVDLQQRAKRVRAAILHDYSHFSVSTIDTFFQKIINSFIREAGLRPGFKLETDQDKLLDEAIDRLLLHTYEKPAVYNQIVAIIDERMESGAAWDIRKLLKEKASLIFKEEFRKISNILYPKISDPAFMFNYSNEVRSVITDFEKAMKHLSSQAIGLMNDADLAVDNFRYGKSGPFGYFLKISKGIYVPSQRVLEALYDESKWIRSRESGMTRLSLEQVVPSLHQLLVSALDLYQAQIKNVSTARVVSRNLSLLALLAEIESNVQAVIAAENLMPISETTHLLTKLIDNSDTPFIYERIGTHFRNYMIDEFQDTSASQWQNFHPLLNNSLSENNFNMVVGDVKQSIYRWRNGDWTILAKKLDQDFAHFGVSHKSLDTNWRSKQAVVNFNNAMFSKFPHFVRMQRKKEESSIPEEINNLITFAYEDVSQQCSPKKQNGSGYVSIEAFHATDEMRSVDAILSQLPELIMNIQDRGYKASDIAILVRRAVEGEQVSDCLLQYKKEADPKYCFDIISQDTLFIASSLAVRLIIGLLKACVNTNDEVNNVFLNHYLQKEMLELSKRKDLKTIQLDLFSPAPIEEGVEFDEFSVKLPEVVIGFLSEINQLSLPEIFEQLITTFKLNKQTSSLPYIQELHDELLKFSKNKLSDISAFLGWWDLNSGRLKLSPGEATEGINVLTIHKSKGLQYPIVIIPFCNWQMKPRVNSLMWVSSDTAPFNALPKIPVNYSHALASSEFRYEYEEETAQSLVDNINLLYVAFTRPEDELYIMLPLGKESDEAPKSYLQTTAIALYNFLNYKAFKQGLEGEKHFIFGSQGTKYTEQEQERTELAINTYTSNNFIKKLRIRYESEDYFSDNANALQQRNYGRLMHRVFAKIITLDDLNDTIDNLEIEGWVDANEAGVLKDKINIALQNPIVYEWFSGKMEVKTEKFLLLPPDMQRIYGFSKRPDRVMFYEDRTIIVDYKFGQVEDKSYIRQVQTYKSLLKSMGYPTVIAYLWYLDSNKVVRVD